MPFVTKEHRKNPDMEIAGDRCYVEYKKIMEAWNKNMRWTTVDKIYEDVKHSAVFHGGDVQRAKELAFMVFFNIHVMDYENKKRRENGDV
jgi:hypothetical protein